MIVSIEVLAERIEALCARVDHGFDEVRSMITGSQKTIDTHTEEDTRVHAELRKALEDVRIDVAVFKARWSILAVVGSAAVSGLISYLMTHFGGKS